MSEYYNRHNRLASAWIKMRRRKRRRGNNRNVAVVVVVEGKQ